MVLHPAKAEWLKVVLGIAEALSNPYAAFRTPCPAHSDKLDKMFLLFGTSTFSYWTSCPSRPNCPPSKLGK